MDYEILMNGNVKIGTYAPDFEAKTTMGKIKLSDYKGKWMILFSHPRRFYPRKVLIFGWINKMPDIANVLIWNKNLKMSNTYISNLLNICNIQASIIINSLKKKGYVKIEIVYKQNSKEIAIRKIIPINKYVNTSKRMSNEPINKNVRDIINNNKIYNKNYRLKNNRDYSNFDWASLYANKREYQNKIRGYI